MVLRAGLLNPEPVTAKNPFVVPDAPKAPEVTAVTKDSMIVVWERPASDGGSEILGYVLEKRDKRGHQMDKMPQTSDWGAALESNRTLRKSQLRVQSLSRERCWT